MNKMPVFVTLMLLLVALFACKKEENGGPGTFPVGENLIQNGDFEQSLHFGTTNTWSLPPGPAPALPYTKSSCPNGGNNMLVLNGTNGSRYEEIRYNIVSEVSGKFDFSLYYDAQTVTDTGVCWIGLFRVPPGKPLTSLGLYSYSNKVACSTQLYTILNAALEVGDTLQLRLYGDDARADNVNLKRK